MKSKGKLIAIALIVVLVFGGWLVDSVRVKSFSVDVVSITPDPGVADGQTPVTIQLRVTQRETPCDGHILYGVSHNGGSFRAKRVTTDENGMAEFIYYPYLKSKLNELTDVTLSFTDESNSLFIAVPARAQVVLEMESPDEDSSDKQTNEGMFG